MGSSLLQSTLEFGLLAEAPKGGKTAGNGWAILVPFVEIVGVANSGAEGRS